MLHKTLTIAAAFVVLASAEPAGARFFGGGSHFAAPHGNMTARRPAFNRPRGPSFQHQHASSRTVNHHQDTRDRTRTSAYPRDRTRHEANGCGDGRCPPKNPPGNTECRRGKCPPSNPPGTTAGCRDGRCRPGPRPYPLPPGGTVIGVPVDPTLPTGTGTTTANPASTVMSTRQPSGPSNQQPPGRAQRAGFDIPPAAERRYRPDEVLLDMGPTASPESLDAMTRRHQLTRLESYRIRLTGTTLHRLRIPDGRAVPDVIADLSGDPRIVSAQPNYLFTLQDGTRPPSMAAPEGSSQEDDTPQYVVSKLRLAEAHRIATGKRVTVAMIDTGVDLSHPYLSGSVAGSFNALGGDDTPDEHGTAMAGAIVEHGDLIGVAPGARLLSVRAFARDANKQATAFAIIQGLDWAVEHGARVINMSFAGPRASYIEPPITAAYRRNVVLVAAAGNDGPRAAAAYPGALPEVIAVTATDADDRLFDYANHGDYIAVAAPGVDVVAPILEQAVKPVSGTSIAAAHVSGVAALLIERNPSLRPQDIRRILAATAVKTGPGARADEFGAGRVDALAAIQSLGPGIDAAEARMH
ncbi:MAG: S8 family serine peptidase [Xanthobacteraceae bacterium]|jgi:hypothetical protein